MRLCFLFFCINCERNKTSVTSCKTATASESVIISLFPPLFLWSFYLIETVSCMDRPPQGCHLLAKQDYARMLRQAGLSAAKYVRGTDYTPQWPVGPTISPKCPALWGLSGPGRLEFGEAPAPRLAASSCPARVSSAPANGRRFSHIR